MEVVKDFYKQIPTLTSFQFRDKVTQLTEVFKQDGISGDIVKPLVSKIGDSFLLRRDSTLQDRILNLLDCLLEKYCETTSAAIIGVLNTKAKEFRCVTGREPQAKLALLLLKWSLKWVSFNPVNIAILEVMSVFLSAIPDVSKTQCLHKMAKKSVFKLFSSERNFLPGRCIELILASSATTSTISLPLLVFLSLALTYCLGHKDLFPHKQYPDILRLFTTSVIAGRTRPEPLLIGNSLGIFKAVTHDLFKEILLPSILKALKRNPDELTDSIATVLSSLPIDLSKYAEDILKNVTSYSHNLVSAIAERCSDKTVAEKILKQLASNLKSSPLGKLTVAEHRCSILASMESLTLCALSSSGQSELASVAARILIAHGKQEVHAGTALVVVNVLCKWCHMIKGGGAEEVLDFIKMALSNKTTPPLLRVGYLLCVLALYQEEERRDTILPLPLPSLTRLSATPSPQAAVLEEVVVAMHVLIKVAYPDPIPPQIWSVVDSHSQQLTSNKLMSSASQETLLALVKVVQDLLCADGCKMKDMQIKMWLGCVVQVLLQSPWQLRRAAAKCIAEVVLVQPIFAEWLVEMVEAAIEKGEFPPKSLLMAMLSLATPTHPKKETLALKTLLMGHHPPIVGVAPDAWMSILRKLGLDPAPFLSSFSNNLTSLIISNMVSRPQASLFALRTLLTFGPDAVSSVLVEEVCQVLGNPRVVGVSDEEMEILRTPRGELWHSGMKKELTSALAGGGVVSSANMKKESKAYSYEDQKWEVELRQEMMKKREEKEEGAEHTHKMDVRELLKKTKLSQKQKQAMETQLADEDVIRSDLTAFSKQLSQLVTLSEVLEGGVLLPHVPRLSHVTRGAFSSPLARGYCERMWKLMVKGVFKEWTLAQMFAESSFCTLTSGGTPSTLKRVFSLLEDHTPDSLDVSSVSHTLTLPLLQHILVSHDSKVVSHDLKESSVTVLSGAVNRYVSRDQASCDPNLFPATETLQLLSDVMVMRDLSAKSTKLKRQCASLYISLLPSMFTEPLPLPTCHALPFITSALLHASPLLRNTVLQALTAFSPSSLPSDPGLLVGVLIARHDKEEGNGTIAEGLWNGSGLNSLLTSDLSPLLLEHCSGNNLVIHDSTALALGVWLEKFPDMTNQVMEKLMTIYGDKRTTPPPTKDSFGREIIVEYQDMWEGRVGVAKALEQLSRSADLTEGMKFLKFVIPESLSDPSHRVQSAMMSAAQAAISIHGDKIAGELMSHSEECLKSIPDNKEADVVRQSIIVLMGTLAKHMDKGNPKVKAVVHLLLGNLDTPSQQVQEAIASCLPPLALVIKPEAEEVIKKLLDKLLDSTSYSQRKGAAYGLAGLIKGLGIPTLKHYQVMAALQEAIKNKKNYRHREGALLAFQSLCNMLGRLFEPYVVHLLPDLLVCFGDGNQYVREATDQTARVIMAHLSSHGVKLILPSLLTALEEDSWRTKAGSAELLGAMAFCAPKQLSSCLPSIVPKLMDVLADSHSKVQASGSQALKQIGSVIKNPEIQELVPVLLDSLSDPSNRAQACLQALLETEFVHVIDPPSLALIMPTLKRTMEARSTDTKKMAAQIIGNMYSLTDKKDLSPYLPDVLPGLKQSLVDPVPEVRTVCAKALGAIARGMGGEALAELLPWLMTILKSETTSVDRSGGAQGISEVLYAQGMEHLEGLIPQFISSSQDMSNPPHVRDGYLLLFVYLPVTFGEQLSDYIGDLLPPILKGLADESEFVRETALQAGQTIVNKYADTAVELFLPQLQKGLFNENWRIRCSSIQLLGDLLYKISGLSGKMSTESEEDENFGTEVAHHILLKRLGKERRDEVLAGLYMGRSDVALIVRQTSLHVWKVVVTNTARTLRDILPTLVHLLLGCLASRSQDKRKVAARTLGDLVRKLGERVLPDVIPMLEKGLDSESSQERQGVCIGLSEIIQQTSRDHVLLYMDSLVPTVRNALCDREAEVRSSAAMTFDSLHSTVGSRVLDEILGPLLLDLSTSSSEQSDVALDGLKQVMAVKSRVVLPHIVPQLIQPPVNIRALALLTSVAGEALYKHLNRIIPALISTIEGSSQDERVWQSADEVVLSVQKEPGPSFLIEELVKCCRDNRPEVRGVAMRLLCTLCSKSTAPLTEHIPHLMIFTTESLNDPSDPVCEYAWLALEAIVKRVNQKELPHYCGYLRKGIRTVSANLLGEELRGFTLKGITPALTLLKEGLISGSPDEKEEAAHVLVEVIRLTSSKTLSTGKVVMLIAGPLIRVLGDRYGWNVKVATLEALVQLVRKVGGAAKAFIPQLQTSYLKALSDPNRPVRVQATTGLMELLPFSPRVDPVFNELHNGVKKSEDLGLRVTMLQALQGVIKVGGQRMSEKHKEDILSTLITLQATAHEGHRLEAARCVGALCAYLSDTQLQNTLATHVLDLDGISDWAVLQARAVTISSALLVASSRMVALGLRDVVTRAVICLATSDRIPVCESGLRSVCSFINHIEGTGEEMISSLCQGLSHSALDARIVACDVCGELLSPSDKVLSNILPLLLQNYKEKNTALKASAESTLYHLIHGEAHLKYASGLLEAPISGLLEDVYLRIQAKHIKKNYN